jgi:catechol 2,3-dioxygenase-like lactoylglutathione lyase family enzyme
MKLEHVALTIFDRKEIGQFYQAILGFREVKSFILKKDLAREIFGIEKETEVYQLQYGTILLELFIMPERFEHVYNHICISIPKREEIIYQASQYGYDCIRIRSQYSDMIFIRDKSRNLFEIKDSQ